jgi:hypothetical protein
MAIQQQSKRLFATSEAARRLGLRPFRLREMQRKNQGPVFCGEGDRIRYEADALKEWVLETLCVNPSRFYP